VLELEEGTRFMVLAPVVRGRKGEYGKLLEELRVEGFTRVWSTASCTGSRTTSTSTSKLKHDVAVVVDRLVMRPDVRKRLVDSIETAAALADGIVAVTIVPRDITRPGETLTFSEKFACLKCGTSMPELEPRIFSFNAPQGACPRCTGLGSQLEIDPELVVPDPSSRSRRARSRRGRSQLGYYEQMTAAIAERYGDRRREAVALAQRAKQREIFLYGTGGERGRGRYRNRFGRERAYARASRGSSPPRAPLPRDRLRVPAREDRGVHERFGRARPATARGCGPSRSRSLSRGRRSTSSARCRRRALDWLDHVELSETERHIARLDHARDRGAAALPRERRHRLPLDGPRGGDAVGRRGAADPARDADRLGARRRALRPRRAVDRAAPARQREARRDARALRDLGNTVLVVEHDEQTMRAPTTSSTSGPGAGEHGGRIVARAPRSRSSSCRSR
jgi:excinuclease ABC subunit A